MEIVQLQQTRGGHFECLPGHQANELTAFDLHAVLSCQSRYLDENNVKRRSFEIGQIHRDLNLTATGQFQSERLDSRKSAAAGPDTSGDGPGYGDILCSQVD